MLNRRTAAVALMIVCLGGLALAQDGDLPLSNWGAPPYWTPAQAPQAESDVRGGMLARAQGMTAQAEALPSSPLPFVAIAPCRIVDTRVATSDGFHQPNFADGEARTFNLPTSPDCPGLPATAGAYSLNIQFRPISQLAYLTSYPTGTTRPLASTMTAGPAAWVQNAAVVPAGTGGQIDIYCQFAGRVVIDINGYYSATGARFGVNRTDRLSWLTVKGGAPATLVGTVTIFNGDDGVIGVGTAFTSQVGVGDRVTVSSETRAVGSIIDDTHLNVVGNWTSNATGVTITDAGSLLRLDDSGDIARLVVSDQGNVGVGVIAPQQTLSVEGTLGLSAGGGTTVLQASPAQVGTVSYTLPQAAADGLLRNTAGTLAWEPATLISGSGSAGQVAFWSGASSLAGSNDLFWDSAHGRLGLGTTTPGFQLDLTGMVNMPATAATAGTPTGGVLFLGGTRFLHNYGQPGTTGRNTFVGELAGNFTMGGGDEFSGSYNTASGYGSLASNIEGGSNTATGYLSLNSNTGGFGNTANGFMSLSGNTTGSENTASGYLCLSSNITGAENTAVGYGSLGSVTDGSNNIAMGYFAGYSVTSGSYNIDIGNPGTSGDTRTTRIGRSSDQTKTFIAGIRGVTTVSANAIAVLIDSSGQLGTVNSSIRFKQDVADMGDTSSLLMELRPVVFHYKTQPNGPLQYGLIAEEVEQVMPDLVVRDATGQLESVAYHELPAMLLNELQKQQAQIQQQQAQIEGLTVKLAASDILKAQLETVTARLAALEKVATGTR